MSAAVSAKTGELKPFNCHTFQKVRTKRDVEAADVEQTEEKHAHVCAAH